MEDKTIEIEETPKVTLYVTCHNYGRFLSKCLESIFCQTFSNWELLVFDDGSKDNTQEIVNSYIQTYPGKIQLITHLHPCGLQRCANEAIEQAKGKYIMRVDADDFLDENALLVMADFLDKHREIGLVYPNYTYVDSEGRVLGVEYRPKIGEEQMVLDLPAHGACTMVRSRVLKSVGGYSENYNAQDGHELWLKVLHRYKVGNVTTPLFFYRQHGNSLSRNEERLLSARRQIKRGAASRHGGPIRPTVAAIIPAKNSYRHLPNVVLNPIGGKPLIDHTIEAALESEICDLIVVSTDDSSVREHCKKFPDLHVHIRPPALSESSAHLSEVLIDAIEHMNSEMSFRPDIVIMLSIHSPLRQGEHIQEALDTLLLYNVDSVISVYEAFESHFIHGKDGLKPLNRGALNQLRYEREALYVDNGAIHAIWVEVVSSTDIYGETVGHIVMPKIFSLQIKSIEDIALVETVLQNETFKAKKEK